MKIEGYLFAFFTVFFLIVSGVYWQLSKDPTGTTCLAFTMGLSFMVGYYLLFTARRMEARPEDRLDGETRDGAGEIGFFPPHSWWPLALAAGFGLAALGVIFGLFLFLIGFAAITAAALGFVFEYYVGINRSQGQTLGALQAMGESPTSAQKFLGS